MQKIHTNLRWLVCLLLITTVATVHSQSPDSSTGTAPKLLSKQSFYEQQKPLAKTVSVDRTQKTRSATNTAWGLSAAAGNPSMKPLEAQAVVTPENRLALLWKLRAAAEQKGLPTAKYDTEIRKITGH
jgi:hypothetical protein